MKQHQKKTVRRHRRLSRLILAGTLLATATLTIAAVINRSRQVTYAKENAQRGAQMRDVKAEELRSAAVRHKVAIDQQTGQVRPLTQQEAQDLATELKRLANRSDQGLTSVSHPDGTVSLNLEDRFQNVALAKKNADGTVEQACIDNPKAGAEFFGIDQKLVDPEANSSASPKSTKN